MANPKKKMGFITGVVLILALAIYSASFSDLNPTECGVKKNKISQQLDTTKVYTAGKHLIGITNNFVVYPTTLQTIDYSNSVDVDPDAAPISAQVKGGLSVKISFSCQYRLMISEAIQLYEKYQQNYHSRYQTILVQEIKQIATQYKSEDFFLLREEIELKMLVACNVALQEHYAVVESFQLRDVEVPSTVDEGILKKLVENQLNQKTLKEQESSVIRAKTSVIESELRNAAKVAVATAQASATKIVNQAEAEAVEIRLDASAQAYINLKSSMGWDNDDLLSYLYLDMLRKPDPNTMLALDISSALVGV